MNLSSTKSQIRLNPKIALAIYGIAFYILFTEDTPPSPPPPSPFPFEGGVAVGAELDLALLDPTLDPELPTGAGPAVSLSDSLRTCRRLQIGHTQ